MKLLGLLRFCLALCLASLLSFPALAQDDSTINTAEFTGIIEAIEGTEVVISGLPVDASGLAAETFVQLEIGVTVTVSGTVEMGTILATTAAFNTGAAVGSISFTGIIDAVDGTTVIVNGLAVDTSTISAQTFIQLVVGVRVTVAGVYENGMVAVINIVVVEATPEATPLPEETPDTTPPAERTPDVDENDDALEIYIVIEGPVQAVQNNIIIIYGFDIALADDDPALTVVQVGDVLRVEGYDRGTVIIANVIIFVSVEVYVSDDDGAVWRGDDCGNAPPPWAPAVGWRARCEGGGDGNGGGRGRGGDDDDDDDD